VFDTGRLGNAKIAQAEFSHDANEREIDILTKDVDVKHKKSVEYRESPPST
jgi:hypothetical protein